MNLNLLGYVIYLLTSAIIIIKVGEICYSNGTIFIAQLIPNHKDLCLRINQILLVAYYLFNLGYCAITIIQWDTIINYPQLLETLALKISIILFLIALLHYLNILIITKQIKKIT